MQKKPTEKLKTLKDPYLVTAEHDRMLQWVYHTAQQHVDRWFKRTEYFEKEIRDAAIEYKSAMRQILSDVNEAALNLDTNPDVQQRLQEMSQALTAFLEDKSVIPSLPIEIVQPKIAEKSLQKPIHGERKEQIAGFMDLMVRVVAPKKFHLTMPKTPFVPYCGLSSGKEERAMRTFQKYGSMELQSPAWEIKENQDISLCIDVRSTVPSLGQLSRELSTLSCLASEHIVCIVLPDNTHEEILREQGYSVLVAPAEHSQNGT